MLLFSYGSNSTAQLRARVENPLLCATPAKAINWQRIFCFNAVSWSGAAASLCSMEGAETYGSVVDITANELAKLDSFEGGYHREELLVFILKDDCWEEVPAIVYLANCSKWTVAPSEAYLTAIYIHLREQFDTVDPGCLDKIDICGVFAENKLEVIDQWVYPGSSKLTLAALCVEVNSKRTNKWIMPRTIGEVKNDFELLGIQSSAQLAAWFVRNSHLKSSSFLENGLSNTHDIISSNKHRSGTDDDFCKAMQFKILDAEALILFRELLKIDKFEN